MNDYQENDQQVARLTMSAKLEYLPAVLFFLGEVSSKLGLDNNETKRLELVVEEACVNVIEHAFDPDEKGTYDIIIARRPGQVAIIVEDKGLPFDIKKFESERESNLGVMLMKALSDEVHFHNLGKQGKRVEIVKNLTYRDVDSYISEEEKQKGKTLPAVSQDTPIEYRFITPDDAVDLARCVYRSYGYTYANDKLYYPDKVSELLESRIMTSVVAIANGEIIGHEGIVKDTPDAKIGEIGMAVVDPRFRGRGVQNKMGNLLKEDARQKGMYGTFADVVSIHPYAQKTVLSHGGRESGILLGYIPATMFFKKIENEESNKRQAVVLFYTRVNEEPLRNVYPPFHHQAMIRRIYEMNNFKRNLISATDVIEKIELPPLSQVDIQVFADKSFAFMKVLQYGADFEKLIKFRLQELCLRRIDCIYIDLPLSHHNTQRFCASMEILGFSFGGILPEFLSTGDVLRLQYMNNVDINIAGTQIASDFGKELFDYVIKAREA